MKKIKITSFFLALQLFISILFGGTIFLADIYASGDFVSETGTPVDVLPEQKNENPFTNLLRKIEASKKNEESSQLTAEQLESILNEDSAVFRKKTNKTIEPSRQLQIETTKDQNKNRIPLSELQKLKPQDAATKILQRKAAEQKNLKKIEANNHPEVINNSNSEIVKNSSENISIDTSLKKNTQSPANKETTVIKPISAFNPEKQVLKLPIKNLQYETPVIHEQPKQPETSSIHPINAGIDYNATSEKVILIKSVNSKQDSGITIPQKIQVQENQNIALDNKIEKIASADVLSNLNLDSTNQPNFENIKEQLEEAETLKKKKDFKIVRLPIILLILLLGF